MYIDGVQYSKHRKLRGGLYFMEKKLVFFGVSIILLTIAFSGCQEEATSVKKTFENISFDSDILELVNGSLDISQDKEIITRVEVTLYFKNLLNEDINLEYVVEFCDKNDNVLFEKPYEIKNFPAGYTEISPDIFSYHGENVAEFDHVNVRVLNYEVIE